MARPKRPSSNPRRQASPTEVPDSDIDPLRDAIPERRTMPALAPEHDGIESIRSQLDAANRNHQTLLEAVQAVIRANTTEDIVRSVLETVRRGFAWEYGSYWPLDREADVLVFGLDSGRIDDEFQK